MNRAERAERDAGVTFVELLVAISVTMILLTIVGALFVNVARASADARNGRAALGTGANAMNELRRVIRVATTNATATGTDPAIVSGDASSLTVYSLVDADPANPAPTRVAFSVDASGNLVEQRTAAVPANGYWTFSGSTTTRTLPGPLVLSGDPLFVYLDASGSPVIPGNPTWVPADRATVASLSITTTVANAGRAGADPIQLTDTVTMPNVTGGMK